jgi:ABC-type Na+ efflux pump permease subunit
VQDGHDQKTPQHRRSRFNVWPVVLRELREGARRPVNRRLRFWSAAIGLLLVGLILPNVGGSAVSTGSYLLVGLHTFLIVMIFLIVPALTADCIARERRDGTLGLLFLTPLSANGIVAGKLLVQALRALTLWLAVLPLLTIPFLSGGVTWFDALTAATLEFCTGIICLGAGLLVSSFARERNSAFLFAYVLALIHIVLFAHIFQFILIISWRGFSFGWNHWLLSRETISIFLGPIGIRTSGLWSSLATVSTLLANIWKWLCWCSPAIAILILYLINIFAAARIKRSWQDKPPSRLRESLFNPSPRSVTRMAVNGGDRKFEVPSLVAPLFRGRFRRRMRRYLERNPIAWLQQYSWKARVNKWCLCLVFLAIACMGASASETTRELMTAALLITLAGFYTFVGVSGFLEEKRSGALELLLVTPITANKLIFGRTWGLWKQFLPAGLVLAGLYANSLWQKYSSDDDLSPIVPSVAAIALGGFLTLPIFATYFALRVKNLIVAAVLTWIALLVPLMFAALAIEPFTHSWGNRSNHPEIVLLPLMILICNAGFALLTCFLLRHSLSRRLYSF